MLLETLIGLSTLLLALLLMGQGLVFDQALWRKSQNQLSHNISVVNCCRYAKSTWEKGVRFIACSQSFRDAGSEGVWQVKLIGESCLVSWTRGKHHGHYTYVM